VMMLGGPNVVVRVPKQVVLTLLKTVRPTFPTAQEAELAATVR
jgi:hypothetical protein